MLGTWSQGRVVQRLPVFSLYSVLATHSWGRPLVCVVEVKWVYLFKGEGPWIQLVSLSRKVRDLLKKHMSKVSKTYYRYTMWHKIQRAKAICINEVWIRLQWWQRNILRDIGAQTPLCGLKAQHFHNEIQIYQTSLPLPRFVSVLVRFVPWAPFAEFQWLHNNSLGTLSSTKPPISFVIFPPLYVAKAGLLVQNPTDQRLR